MREKRSKPGVAKDRCSSKNTKRICLYLEGEQEREKRGKVRPEN